MKKLISVFLALTLLLSCFAGIALAEDFTLRNGILFGDSMATVKDKETFVIQESSADNTDLIWYDGGTVAGINCDVRYDFSESDALTDMLYSFERTTDRTASDNNYEKLRGSLIRKYGDPLGNTGGRLHLITGNAFEYAALLLYLYDMLDCDGDLRDYEEWIVECDGYKVKIDLCSIYITDTSETNYYNFISYHYFTEEDYQNAVKQKQEENDAIDDDL